MPRLPAMLRSRLAQGMAACAAAVLVLGGWGMLHQPSMHHAPPAVLSRAETTSGSSRPTTAALGSAIATVTAPLSAGGMSVPVQQRGSATKINASAICTPVANPGGEKRFRCKPSYLVIGMTKCGTTSMYSYLKVHPQIHVYPMQEGFFFMDDPGNVRGRFNGYLSSFPTLSQADIDKGIINGEHSPSYLWRIPYSCPKPPHKWNGCSGHEYPPDVTAQNIHTHLPHAKLIVVFRDPIQRAYSNFAHFGKNACIGPKTPEYWPDCFHTQVEQQIANLRECLAEHPDKTMLCVTGPYEKWNPASRSVALGLYIEILALWMDKFPPSSFCFVDITFFKPSVVNGMRIIEKCLGIAPFDAYPELGAMNQKGSQKGVPGMHNKTRALLQQLYAPYNKRLCEEHPSTCLFPWI